MRREFLIQNSKTDYLDPETEHKIEGRHYIMCSLKNDYLDPDMELTIEAWCYFKNDPDLTSTLYAFLVGMTDEEGVKTHLSILRRIAYNQAESILLARKR